MLPFLITSKTALRAVYGSTPGMVLRRGEEVGDPLLITDDEVGAVIR